ncbi:MAG: indole-3-glycerol phosphate synthase TrpC [Kiritimatiellae bacterium]|nr:indole-3-glycerol phosphate synthase TrpC [Kiritimatiellia bacterium]
MTTILETIAEHARERVAAAKAKLPQRELEALARERRAGAAPDAFYRALRAPGLSFICECKKASPSKGVIAEDYAPVDIARSYAEAGADAISVLTEPRWFLGSDAHLRDIAAAVAVPCLRKDFTVDPWMIWEAAALGAEAVLLIVSLLDAAQLRDGLALCRELGLSALVETRDATQIETALACGARIVGVNNRNLADFTVDGGKAAGLRPLVPPEAVFVAESGVHDGDGARVLREAGVDAILVGEAMMRAPDKRAKLAELRGLA